MTLSGKTKKKAVKKQKRKTKPKKNFGKILFSLILAVSIIAMFVLGPRNIFQYYSNKREKARLQDDIEALKLKKAKLDSELTHLTDDPQYLEKIAREKYNMKKKGEKVYKIIKEE